MNDITAGFHRRPSSSTSAPSSSGCFATLRATTAAQTRYSTKQPARSGWDTHGGMAALGVEDRDAEPVAEPQSSNREPAPPVLVMITPTKLSGVPPQTAFRTRHPVVRTIDDIWRAALPSPLVFLSLVVLLWGNADEVAGVPPAHLQCPSPSPFSWKQATHPCHPATPCA